MKKLSMQIFTIFLFTQATFLLLGMDEDPFAELQQPQNSTVNINFVVVPQVTTQIAASQSILAAMVSGTNQRIAALEQDQGLLGGAAHFISDVAVGEMMQQQIKIALLEQNVQRTSCYKAAKRAAKKEGIYAGILPGITYGIGLYGSMYLYPALFQNFNPAAVSFVTGCAVVAMDDYSYQHKKKQFYNSLRNNPDIAPEDKSKIKKKFDDKGFLARSITAAAAFSGCFSLFASSEEKGTVTTFCTVFPAAFTGIAGIYGIRYLINKAGRSYKRNRQAVTRSGR